MQGATPKPWRSLHKLRQHFWDHGGEVGTADQAAYDASAQETVHIGRRFAYNDFDSGQPRVGYFDTTGEGRFLPDSQPEDAVEESSGFVVADDGQIFSYWLGWDPKDERPAFTDNRDCPRLFVMVCPHCM